MDAPFTSHLAPRRIPHAKSRNITNPVLLTEYPSPVLGDKAYGAHVTELNSFLDPPPEPPEQPTPKSPVKGAPLYRSYLRPAETRFARLQGESMTKYELKATEHAYKALPLPTYTVRNMRELSVLASPVVGAGAPASPAHTSPGQSMADLVTFGNSHLTDMSKGQADAGGAGAGAGAGVSADAGASASRPAAQSKWEPSNDMVFDKDNKDTPPHAAFLFQGDALPDKYKATAAELSPPARRRKKRQPETKGIVLPWEAEAAREEERRRKRREAKERERQQNIAEEQRRLEAARKPLPLMEHYLVHLKPERLSDQAFTRAVHMVGGCVRRRPVAGAEFGRVDSAFVSVCG